MSFVGVVTIRQTCLCSTSVDQPYTTALTKYRRRLVSQNTCWATASKMNRDDADRVIVSKVDATQTPIST